MRVQRGIEFGEITSFRIHIRRIQIGCHCLIRLARSRGCVPEHSMSAHTIPSISFSQSGQVRMINLYLHTPCPVARPNIIVQVTSPSDSLISYNLITSTKKPPQPHQPNRGVARGADKTSSTSSVRRSITTAAPPKIGLEPELVRA
jgi:hypothetical protein